MIKYTPTNGRKPRTTAKLLVEFRNGYRCKWEYTADQLRWSNSDPPSDWDIVGVRIAK